MRALEKSTNEQLTALLSQGNEAAYTEIFNRYWEKLLAIAYNHTRDKAEAQEIVQEVMIRLWEKRSQIAIRSLEHYMAVAVRLSVFKRLHQKNRRSEILRSKFGPNQSFKLEEEMDALFLKEYVNGVVEQLPDKCRLVFQYSRDRYKPNAEIARELDISEKTVEAHLTRAIKTLRLNLRKAGILFLNTLGFWLF